MHVSRRTQLRMKGKANVMMNLLEEAIIYATIMHQGKVRKFGETPFILHPMEVAHILSTMTEDQEVITAGILHDIVENTDGTLEEIHKRFGDRVAFLVSKTSENEYPGLDPSETWLRRKEESLLVLKNSRDIGVQMLWLADQLANIRTLAVAYAEYGDNVWQALNQVDPSKQCWFYRSIAECVELSLNKTGAFKELIKHINFIWPGTFEAEKTRYRKYKEISLDGCKQIGSGAKGEVYRYNDEVVIKVYNQFNTYRDVEHEISYSRRAFVLGVPTAISFGIVSVGDRYGAMYELVDTDTMSVYLAKAPSQVDAYAKIMANLARTVHGIEVTPEDGFPDVKEKLRSNVRRGISYRDPDLAQKCMKLIDSLPDTNTLLHGDFHTGNVFLQDGEPVLIDMDKVTRGHPIVELGDMYMYYVVLGDEDPSVIENFMGFSYETSIMFFRRFLRFYLDTEDEARLDEVTEKASMLSYIRMIRKIWGGGKMNDAAQKRISRYMDIVAELADRLDTLAF